MQYLLQVDNEHNIVDIEVFNAKSLINECNWQNKYVMLSLVELKDSKEDFSNFVPIGDLCFVGLWLKKYHNVTEMKPIEVPEVLRKEKYLGREYNFVKFDEIEWSGYKFLKDVDKLKQFSYLGNLRLLDKNNGDFVSENYLISEVVDIVAEYRVFVSDTDIKGIQFYDGICTIFPDVKLLQEMVGIYYIEKNRPKSYTMDIAVLKNGRTVILEVHPVVSVGTYGYYGLNLLKMYKDGVDYYIRCLKGFDS